MIEESLEGDPQALALCPFCEGAPVLRSRNAGGVASGKHHFVRCPFCHAEGPRSTTSAQSAIAAWNRRAASALPAAPVAPTRAEVLEEAAKLCDAIEVERWSVYKGTPPNERRPDRGSDLVQGMSIGAGRCAEAIRAAAPAGAAPAEDALEQREATSDTKRLDWLDARNRALNAHYGTVYGWKVVLSPNVTRLMTERPPIAGFIADVDVHDSATRGHDSVRAALDEAMAQQEQPK